MKEQKKIRLNRFNYYLPEKLISQEPIKPRDHARLLILDKNTSTLEHKKFYNIIDYLNPGDVLVLNNSKVIPARLLGQKETGGKIEIFLLTKKSPQIWQTLIKGKVNPGQKISLNNVIAKSPKATKQSRIIASIIKKHDKESWLVKFNTSDKKLFTIGKTPLPPYIKKQAKLADYQTVYAKDSGSVAAPTAGLHFTKNLINKLKKKGIKIEYITLHVGLGTFLPVKSQYIQDHTIHSELAIVSPKTATALNKAKERGNKIIAVGTTATRTLEAFTKKSPSLLRRGLGEVCRYYLVPSNKWVNIFIYPGYKFKFVDSIITNFHLPKSTLLMLVSAFANEKKIKIAYQEAINKKYKFYSFGDAMFIK